MRALLLVGILAGGAFVLSGCGSAKIEQPKAAVEYDPARDGTGDEIAGGPGGGKKGPKAGLNKPGGGGAAVP